MARGRVDWDRDESPPSAQVPRFFDVAPPPAQFRGGGLGLVRSGRNVFASRMEHGLPEFSGVGTVAEDTSTGKAWSGPKSLKLTTAAGIGSTSGIIRYFNAFPNTLLGLEVTWLANAELDERFWFGLEVHRGGQKYTAYLVVEWLTALKQLSYGPWGGPFTQVADLTDAFSVAAFNWHVAKIVVDLANLKYKWAMLDGVGYDLSAVSMDNPGTSTSVFVALGTYIVAAASAVKSMYLGGFVVTVDELAAKPV